MITTTTTTKLTDYSVIPACLLGSRLLGTGPSGAVLGGNERPTKALAAVEARAQVRAFAVANAAVGAGAGSEKTQRHMWAFRGLKPWRDPA